MLISDWSSDVGSSDLTKVDLHLEQLWSRNVTITTRLVDTVSTPMLLKTVEAKRLQSEKRVTHRFALDDILVAYETFSNAAASPAQKVVIDTCRRFLTAGAPLRYMRNTFMIDQGSSQRHSHVTTDFV